MELQEIQPRWERLKLTIYAPVRRRSGSEPQRFADVTAPNSRRRERSRGRPGLVLARVICLQSSTDATKLVRKSCSRSVENLVSLERAGLLGREDFNCLYFKDIRGIFWPVVADEAVSHCRRIGANLLVVDTLGQFAGVSGDSENNSGDALAAMLPLQEAAGNGIAVMILRHDRKSGGLVGESGRGSSAYSGAVDVVMSIRRPEGNTRKTLRTIHAVGRFDETPEEFCIELTEQDYVSLGTAAHVAEAEAEQFILANAPCTPEEAIALDELIKDSKQSRSTNNRVMKELCSKGVMQTTGLGKKGNPFKYFRMREPGEEG
jgi:hypothetical protein